MPTTASLTQSLMQPTLGENTPRGTLCTAGISVRVDGFLP